MDTDTRQEFKRGRVLILSRDPELTQALPPILKADGYAPRTLLHWPRNVNRYLRDWCDSLVVDCAERDLEVLDRVTALRATNCESPVLWLVDDLPRADVLNAFFDPSDDFLLRRHATAETVLIAIRRQGAYQELRHEIADLRKELTRLQSRGEGSLERLKFLRFASHELKAPLVAGQSCLRVLDELLDTGVDPRVRKLVSRCLARSDQMLSMLNDLLSVSVDRSDVAAYRQDLDLVVLLREVLEQQFPEMEAKHLTVKTELPKIPMICNASRYGMERVLSNLVSNAVRYTPSEGSIVISLGICDGHVRLVVSDSGIGIAEEDLGRIFESFYRAQNARKFVPYGSGLGLALVQKVVQDHGGWVQVDSKVDKGTTIQVWIPTKGSPAPG